MGKAAEALHDIADDPDAEIAKRDERIEQLEAELKEANEALEDAKDDHASEMRDLEELLVDLKYWLEDGLFHHKPVTSPRRMLTKIERALDL